MEGCWMVISAVNVWIMFLDKVIVKVLIHSWWIQWTIVFFDIMFIDIVFIDIVFIVWFTAVAQHNVM